MVMLQTWEQQPAEYRIRKIDYSNWLSETEIIVGITHDIETLRGPAGTGNDFVVDVAFIDPEDFKSVYFYAGYGYDSDDYKVTFTIQTNLNQTRQDELRFQIYEV